MRYQCNRCNYSADLKEMPKRCPYCGEAGTMKKAALAQDLLDEASFEQTAKEERIAARGQKRF